ncbi:MAG: hypothetical protein RMJ98_20780 [Myxococcales bacterium]|nr:hypothetical protein [Polyangiaceae bacterium]MDW8251738.1 hypothetical protein [Myxococcales bacterium]
MSLACEGKEIDRKQTRCLPSQVTGAFCGAAESVLKTEGAR